MTFASIMQIMWNRGPLLYDGIPKTQFFQLFLCLDESIYINQSFSCKLTLLFYENA